MKENGGKHVAKLKNEGREEEEERKGGKGVRRGKLMMTALEEKRK